MIASSVSNGAGPCPAAAERDRSGLIDGVAVSEPGSTPAEPDGVIAGRTPRASGKTLVDQFTSANLLSALRGAVAPGVRRLPPAADCSASPRPPPLRCSLRQGRWTAATTTPAHAAKGAGQAARLRLEKPPTHAPRCRLRGPVARGGRHLFTNSLGARRRRRTACAATAMRPPTGGRAFPQPLTRLRLGMFAYRQRRAAHQRACNLINNPTAPASRRAAR